MADERLAAETLLSGATRGLLHLVYVRAWPKDLARVPIDPTGSNPLYNVPIGWAASAIGAPPASPVAVTDDDVARVIAAGHFYLLGDLGEYRLLRDTLGNFAQTDEMAGGRSQYWGSLADRYYRRIADLEKLYPQYMPGSRPQLNFGTITLPIQARPGDAFFGPEF